MYLSPGDQEKLLLTVAAEVARRRRQRGLKLNVPETVALIADAILEAARDGKSVAECVALGKQVIRADEVMPEVPEVVRMVQVEATFSDGTKLVTCHDPVGPARPASQEEAEKMAEGPIGGYDCPAEVLELNPGRLRRQFRVTNLGDRPIQVGSHYHFAEVNPALDFDRRLARGMRLDIPAGTAVRFEPGMTLPVTLVGYGGRGRVVGFRGATQGLPELASGEGEDDED